eukprot:GHVS01074154.1.p2 GENE.GHVS01074154.1~~GHVS01074154.1.p2  ORF type:complete len:118 (-),score=13.96 GHVS01074154.1:703-1056(-)
MFRSRGSSGSEEGGSVDDGQSTDGEVRPQLHPGNRRFGKGGRRCSPNRSRFAPMDGHGIRHISGPTNKVADLLSRLIDTSHDDDEPEEFLLPPMPTLQEFEADGNDIPEAEKKWHRE